MAKEWYILQAYTGKENVVERSIRSIMSEEKFSQYIFDVRSPIDEVTEQKNGKKRVRRRNVLPGYILVQMSLPDTGWKELVMRVQHMEFVSSFVGSEYGKRPNAISNDEAKQFLVLSGDKSIKSAAHAIYYAEGDSVRINDGPFKSFIGRVEEVMDDRQKLRIMVGIFGRLIPVEVDYDQVETV